MADRPSRPSGWESPRAAGTEEPPGAPPRPWRLSGRLLVVDPAERVLLVRAHDPEYPELGEWWEVPGGGVDPGEDTVAAALREVREETGIAIGREAVVPAAGATSAGATSAGATSAGAAGGGGDAGDVAVWRQEVTYLWLGHRRWSRQAIHVACPPATPEVVAELAYTPDEGETFLGADWIPVADLDRLRRTFPDGIAQMLPRLRAGEVVDAGFTVWC